MIRKIALAFCLIVLAQQVIAQDEKMLNISLIGGIDPGLYISILAPINLVVHVDYNITDNISAGIFYQHSMANTKLSFTESISDNSSIETQEAENFSEIAISQFGVSGIYRYNTPGTTFRPYALLTAGSTSVQQKVDQTNHPFSELSDAGFDDFSQHFIVNESSFTVGLGLGVELKLIRSFGATIQVTHYDLFGLISDEAKIMTSTSDTQFIYDITNGYISTTTPIYFRKYVPIYVNLGVYFKLLKRKI